MRQLRLGLAWLTALYTLVFASSALGGLVDGGLPLASLLATAVAGWSTFRLVTWDSGARADSPSGETPFGSPPPRIAPPPPAPPPLRPPGPGPVVPRSVVVEPMGEREGRWCPPSHVPTQAHVARLHGFEVRGFAPDYDPVDGWTDRVEHPDRVALAIGTRADYRHGEEPAGVFERRFEALLADPAIPELQALLLGSWNWEICDEPPLDGWQHLVAAAPRLTSLTHLFLGEATQDEMEVSWITLGDVGPVLWALPRLTHAWIRGGSLALSGLESATLEQLTLQTGGMDRALFAQLRAARLPRLRSLTVWLGSSNYGYDVDAADIPALLDAFPHLEHLGVQDADNQDEVVEQLLRHPGIARLRSLDLSMGTLSDRGARALIACEAVRGLRHLNLRHHFIQDAALLDALRALGPEVDLSGGLPADDVFVEVSE